MELEDLQGVLLLATKEGGLPAHIRQLAHQIKYPKRCFPDVGREGNWKHGTAIQDAESDGQARRLEHSLPCRERDPTRPRCSPCVVWPEPAHRAREIRTGFPCRPRLMDLRQFKETVLGGSVGKADGRTAWAPKRKQQETQQEAEKKGRPNKPKRGTLQLT